MKKIKVTLICASMAFSAIGCASKSPTSAPSELGAQLVNKPDTVKNYMQSIELYHKNKDLSNETERKMQILTENYLQTKMIIDKAVNQSRSNTN